MLDSLYVVRCPYQPLLTNGIPVTGDNQCIDVRAESGSTQESPYNSLKDVQSWQCSGGNPNQVRSVSNPHNVIIWYSSPSSTDLLL